MDVAKLIERLRDFIDHMSVAPEYAEETSDLIEAAAALETIRLERDELSRIISECAEAVGAGIADAASLTFKAKVPGEIRLVRKRIERERDEAREALDRANDYLRFVARWAWRESEGLTDVERLSAIKYYPPIKALAAGEPAPLSPKEAEE